MAGPLNAKVIMAKCSKTQKCFGIRIEQRGNEWVQTWAFPIDERKAAREGYSASSTVTLSGKEDDGFPGCPHCGTKMFFICACGKLSCSSIGAQMHTCPWCRQTYGVQQMDKIDVSGGGY